MLTQVSLCARSTATFQPAALWGSYHEDYGEETKTQGSPVGKVERCKLITQSSNSTVFSNHGMELSNQHLRDENETLRQRGRLLTNLTAHCF